MESSSTPSRPCIPSCNSRGTNGFTVVEFVVSSALGLIVMAVILGVIITTRQLYAGDLARTRVNQNLRGAFDIISADVKQAGENLTSTFPALELSSGTTDTLTIRRGLIEQIPTLCAAIGTVSASRLYIARGAAAGCTFGGNLTNYNAWSAYRTANGGSVDAFIYDVSTRLGEFFTYTGETNTGTELYLQTNGAAFANAYTVGATAIYLIEEWKYQVVGDLLQVTIDQDTANPLSVIFGVTDFQASVTMANSTVVNTFARGDGWTNIQSIALTLSGTDSALGKTYDRTLSTTIFPRNILSF